MADGSQQLIDILPEPCLLVSLGGEVLRANPAFLKVVKLEPGSVTGKQLVHLTATDEKKVRAYLELCSRNRSLIMGALSFRTDRVQETFRCEGAAVPADLTTASMILLRFKSKQTAVARFRVLNEKIQQLTQEIRRRLVAEEALRGSEALFRELADAMPQIVWAARPDGAVVYYNRRWYELTGAEKNQIGDESWLPILHPDDRQKSLDLWYHSVRTGANYQIEYRLHLAHEKRYRWHLARALPARDQDGKIIRWFGTCTDIDDQKQAAEKLEQAVAERTASLREAVAQMEEFSYSVSHDLRAPARAMQGYAKVLLSEYGDRLDSPGLDLLERIVRAGTRMDKMITDVLTFSLLTRSELQLQPISLDKLVNEVIQQDPRLQPPRAQIDVAALPIVSGHEPSLTQVVSNLFTNAVKFVAPHTLPRIVVRADREGSQVRIWIEDNGIGITPENQQRIFGLFERAPSQHRYEGTGVGLAIVRRALERMGGQVGVVSDGVQGSRFWIRLPAAEGD